MDQVEFIHVVGARPNFMKVAPVFQAFAKLEKEQKIVHTGQHYDHNMSDVFFEQLEIPRPHVNLEVGSHRADQQISLIMQRFGEFIVKPKKPVTIVYGDVNSTLACALVCNKLGLPCVHVEAGIRSFDRRMPEEINRILTDQLVNYLLTPSSDAEEHLRNESVPGEIHFVGNVMIDTLVKNMEKAKGVELPELPADFILLTMHRPSNVDDQATLESIVKELKKIAQKYPVVFPIHPRTKSRLEAFGIELPQENFTLLEPLGYLEFLALQMSSLLILTDSGGIQEESCYLGKPCFVLRENTERPITLTEGSCRLMGDKIERLAQETFEVMESLGDYKPGRPQLWDGKAGDRIARLLSEKISQYDFPS